MGIIVGVFFCVFVALFAVGAFILNQEIDKDIEDWDRYLRDKYGLDEDKDE